MKRNFLIKSISIWMITVLTALSFASCQQRREQEPSQETVTFCDALGREVSVPIKPQRVAALLGSFAEVWLLAGGTVCAAAEDAWEDFGLELDDAVNLGGAHSPSLEKLVASEPDFVIGSASTASNVEICESLEQMGITVAYFDVDHFEDYLAMLKICTDLTGRADLYEQNGLVLQVQIEQIKADYAEQAFPEAERKVLLLRAASSFIKAKGSEGTVLGEMLRDMGCINIADSDQSLLENLGVESMIQKEPYHIFVVTMGKDPQAAEQSFEKWMKENPAWGTLTAVREGRVHWMDRSLFHNKPNARWAQAYESLYETLTK